MGVIICDKSKNKDKKIVEANPKIEVDNNSTKETDKNNNNNKEQYPEKNNTKEANDNTKNDEGKENKNLENIKEQKEEKLMVTIDSKFLVGKGSSDPNQIYIRKKILGRGSFGTVYLVKHRDLTRYFAMKVIKKSSSKNNEEE